MGRPGRQVVGRVLPAIRAEYAPDLVIAQAENVTHGTGMSLAHMQELRQAGIDFFTGGNHSLTRRSLLPLLADPTQPVIAPFNHPGVDPAWGAKVISTRAGQVLVVSLLGTTFPIGGEEVRNPLLAVDQLLASTKDRHFVARIINFHGDFSSEKRVIGYYLDGRVSAVIGDHWHVPTADAMVLPGGTAHITDVGMCGTLHSSLGVDTNVIVRRWRDGLATKNELSEAGPYQFNAVLITVDTETGLARSIVPIQKIIDTL